MDSSKKEEPIASAVSQDIALPPSEEADRKKLLDYIDHLEESIQSRKQEQEVNTGVEYPEEYFFSALDSKLKSCQGFMKRVKNLTESQYEAIEKDFQGDCQNSSEKIGKQLRVFWQD